MLKLTRLSGLVKNIPGLPEQVADVLAPAQIQRLDGVFSSSAFDFYDKAWDMRERINDSEGSDSRIDFTYYLRGVEDLEIPVKLSALYYWKDTNRFAPVKQYVRNITIVLSAARQYTLQLDYRKYTSQMVIYAINKHTNSPDNRRHLLSATLHFFKTMLKLNPSEKFLINIDDLIAERSKYKVIKMRKTPDFDDRYFQRIVSAANEVMNDSAIEINLRKAAAVVILEAWTGLRRNEIFNLRRDCLSVKKSVYGIDVVLLSYRSTKVNGHEKGQFKTVCFPLAKKAIEVLDALQGDVKSVYLLPSPATISRVDSRARLEYWINKFFYQFVPECLKSQTGIESFKFNDVDIYCPTPTNFRVHLCGLLYKHHVALPIIELGMSHLTETMIAYYYRERAEERSKVSARVKNIFSLMDSNYVIAEDDHLHNLVLNICKLEVIAQRYDNCTDESSTRQRRILCALADEIIEKSLYPCLQIIKIIGVQNVVAAFPEIEQYLKNGTIERLIEIWKKRV